MTNKLYRKKCTKAQRCELFKTCEICARIRQAKIATKAEKLDILAEPLFFSVFKPHENTTKGIQALRASIIRRKLTVGGLWTVEKGEQFGQLHLNLISPELKHHKIKNCETWSQAITTSTRSAAAYISKQKGIPDDNTYSGQLYGTFGQIFDIAVNKGMTPVVQGAAIEMMLNPDIKQKALNNQSQPRQAPKPTQTKTKAEYQTIAQKHLKNLYQIANSIKSQNNTALCGQHPYRGMPLHANCKEAASRPPFI